ncbi:hypothetical protein HD554DRAFT_2038389 [Boletus coccyginus]|nr:hypothetical protein HD554DRAFT_2038389 [Boletus coccyginus]
MVVGMGHMATQNPLANNGPLIDTLATNRHSTLTISFERRWNKLSVSHAISFQLEDLEHTPLSPYQEQAEKQGWTIKSKSIKVIFVSGYTFKTLKYVLIQPGVKLDALPPPPTPDPSNHIPTSIISSQQPALSAPFTINGLNDYIVHYLIANNLAINKIESPEFHQLLLYCSL